MTLNELEILEELKKQLSEEVILKDIHILPPQQWEKDEAYQDINLCIKLQRLDSYTRNIIESIVLEVGARHFAVITPSIEVQLADDASEDIVICEDMHHEKPSQGKKAANC